MKSSIYKVFLGGLLVASLQANAQNALQASSQTAPKITLQQAVDMALRNNIAVKQSEVQLQNALLNHQQAQNNMLPNATGNINEYFNFGRSLDPFTNTYVARNINYNTLSLNAGVTVFNGYFIKNTIAQNQLLVQATQLDMQAMKESVAMQVVLAYLNTLNAEDQLAIAQSQTGITRLQIERTEKLVRAGSLPQSNVLDLKAQLANEETTVINNQSTLELAKLSLLQLLNDKNIGDVSLDRIAVPTPASSTYELSAANIFQVAEANQPIVKAADLRVKSAEKGIAIAKAGFMPTVSLSGSFGANQSNAQKEYKIDGVSETNLGTVTLNNVDYPLVVKQPKMVESGTIGYFKQLENTFNYGFGINMNIPIFSRFANKTRVGQAKLQRLNADLEAQKTRQTLRQNIEQAYTNMTNAAKRFEAITTQVTALEESFRAAESRFNAGAIDFVAYNLQKTNLDKAKANLVQAKYDYVFRIKILDYYQNKPLTF